MGPSSQVITISEMIDELTQTPVALLARHEPVAMAIAVVAGLGSIPRVGVVGGDARTRLRGHGDVLDDAPRLRPRRHGNRLRHPIPCWRSRASTSSSTSTSTSSSSSSSSSAMWPPGQDARPGWRIALTTMPATRPTLGVSFWPDFTYDASGATTLGTVTDVKRHAGRSGSVIHLDFDVSTFEGPPVCGRTTKVFGVPLPPGVRIDIRPISLKGFLDTATGECRLDFDARFEGSIFGEEFIKLPPMTVRSPLTTGETRGEQRSARGSRFGTVALEVPSSPMKSVNGDSALDPCLGGTPGDLAELVAVASVPVVKGDWDWLMNVLLRLPADALAVLPCRLRLWDPKDVEREGSTEDERAVVRALDDRFELHECIRAERPHVTGEQTSLAMLTFGAATYVEEAHQLVL